jgi:predicted DNA-binding transcriptional regulator AlpA
MNKQGHPVYINTRQLRDRYGGVSHMWIERRIADDLSFPQPIYMGARRFWLLAKIEAWERVKAEKSSAKAR